MLKTINKVGRWTAATIVMASWISTSAQAIEPPKTDPVDGKVKWVYDYEAGKKLSRESGKPMFVVFRCER